MKRIIALHIFLILCIGLAGLCLLVMFLNRAYTSLPHNIPVHWTLVDADTATVAMPLQAPDRQVLDYDSRYLTFEAPSMESVAELVAAMGDGIVVRGVDGSGAESELTFYYPDADMKRTSPTVMILLRQDSTATEFVIIDIAPDLRDDIDRIVVEQSLREMKDQLGKMSIFDMGTTFIGVLLGVLFLGDLVLLIVEFNRTRKAT